MDPHYFPHEILRKYDIRGVVGLNLTAADAYYLGRSYAKLLHLRNLKGSVAVGRDGRMSSPQLFERLCLGLLDSGISVVDIGMVPTPVLYFATAELPNIAGGIMVTGSHNPVDQNGFKITMGGLPLFDQDILYLAQLAKKGDYPSGEGEHHHHDIMQSYLEFIDTIVDRQGRQFNVVWDPGNGASGRCLSSLLPQLPGSHLLINGDVDGTFPNHPPNPSDPVNLEQLIREVTRSASDFGFAFDGDGDRLVMVDSEGNIVSTDKILVIMAQELLRRRPGAVVMIDVKMGDWVMQIIKDSGGTALFCPTGHSFFKTNMQKVGALLGGEMSGHLFFSENYHGFDDGVLGAVKMMSILSQKTETLEQLLSAMPVVFGTPEIYLPSTEAAKFVIVDELKKLLLQKGVEFSEMDGVRVRAAEGWWIIRASNTEAKLSLRVESSTPQGLRVLKDRVRALLAVVGVAWP